MSTITVFRKWSGPNAGVIALFPALPGDLAGNCLSYEHVGQHGSADYHTVVGRTTPASFREYAALAKELRRLGYRIRVLKRASRSHRIARMRELRRLYS